MNRDWKPGDVAMVNNCTNPHAPWKAATCVGASIKDKREAEWILHETGARVWSSVSDARPLAVIDPEDAEQIKRLADAYAKPQGLDEAGPNITAAMTVALREFANPTPRIEEPAGLGAVVEDDRGPVRVLSEGVPS